MPAAGAGGKQDAASRTGGENAASGGRQNAAKQTYERVDKSKVQALKELLEKTDEPVLIFVKYIAEAEIVKNEIAGAEIFSTDKIERWNNGKIKRMIANPKSMGHGLNLQRGGRIVVWYNITASLELYEQANARVYRHGQKERVIIYNLLCKGSIDDVIRFRILKKKENLKDAVMGLLSGQAP
jgi:SNF2 family DNA or RNA helicase